MYNFTHNLRPVSGISHPLVSDMYLKKDFSSDKQNVLVIKAHENRAVENDTEHDGFDCYLMGLLVDLEDLKEKVEKKGNIVDRVDIRTS